jgi:hypothetical protein
VIAESQEQNDSQGNQVDLESLIVAGEWLTVKYKKKKKVPSVNASGSGGKMGNIPPSVSRCTKGGKVGTRDGVNNAKFGIFNPGTVGPAGKTNEVKEKRKIEEPSKQRVGSAKEVAESSKKNEPVRNNQGKLVKHPGATVKGRGKEQEVVVPDYVNAAIRSPNFMEVLRRHEELLAKGGGIFHAKPPDKQ